MIATLLLLTVPYDATLTVRCDVQEVNHVMDLSCDTPRLVLSQLIVRNLGEVRDWRNLKSRPVYDWERRQWRSTWIENGRCIEVVSPVMVESVTDYDRELIEREWLPIEQRRRLSQ